MVGGGTLLEKGLLPRAPSSQNFWRIGLPMVAGWLFALSRLGCVIRNKLPLRNREETT